MKHFLKSSFAFVPLLLFGCGQVTEATRRADAALPDDAPAAEVGGDVAVGNDAPAPVDVAAPPDGPTRWTPPPGTNPMCVSGTRWTMGNEDDPLMNPGQACVACHRMDRRAPQFTASGTAYFLDHEVDNCNGYTGAAPGGPSGMAAVEVVDATGRMVRMPVNAAGNFFTRSNLTYPLRSARVIGPTGLTNEMSSPVPHGDCNGCHTAAGTNTGMGDPAPGRVIVPL